MGRVESLQELRAFDADFREYAGILREAWRRNPGEGWYGSTSLEQRDRLDELRSDLPRQYGRLRPALAEAQGGIPVLGNRFATAGDIFSVALADPRDNPWLSSALDASLQTIGIAIGHFERTQREDAITLTSPVYWWRRSRRWLGAAYKEIKEWLGIIVRMRP